MILVLSREDTARGSATGRGLVQLPTDDRLLAGHYHYRLYARDERSTEPAPELIGPFI